ncbi:MAG: hypothetical protein H7330_00825 [Hymenobacteraceae bacterium]|nr:hypothetical protein [Hymenobacteraceae bacterium]
MTTTFPLSSAGGASVADPATTHRVTMLGQATAANHRLSGLFRVEQLAAELEEAVAEPPPADEHAPAMSEPPR